ncbi:MAG: ClpXP protease specificity-enhancing factor [Proteobacteria bacterium]|nr:ClpXP protease specificity-enhancing factor [Pseudomonadota bacterium]
MLNKRPYLLNALYEWIVDSGETPYLIVAVTGDDVVVPRDRVENGKIVLNISPTAVRNLLVDQAGISFDGRFSGQSWRVSAPMGSVSAIYSRESGDGMMFDIEQKPEQKAEAKAVAGSDKEADQAAVSQRQEKDPSPTRTATDATAKPKSPKGHLKVIK